MNFERRQSDRWHPFVVDQDCRIPPRPLGSPGNAGIGDRLRSAAFAELQAEAAFTWAAHHFTDAPAALRSDWLRLAIEEKKHRLWLVGRMDELNLSITERPVSDALWRSLTSRNTPRDFCHFMAGAEDRGRRAAERFYKYLISTDPTTATIFGNIASEEVAHIQLAYRFYPL